MSHDNPRARHPHSVESLAAQHTGTPGSSPQQPHMSTAFGYASPSANAAYQHHVQAHPQIGAHSSAQPEALLHQAPNPYHQPPRRSQEPQQPNPQFIEAHTSVLMPVNEESSLPRAKLTVLQGEQRGEVWYLNRAQVSLGRALDNDIVLLDISSSRKHAQVLRHAHGFTLLDLRSANGVFLNRRRITEEELYDGDEVEIGETLISFETIGSARQRIADEDDTSPGIQSLSQPMHQSAGYSSPAPKLSGNFPPPLPPHQPDYKSPSQELPIPIPHASASVPASGHAPFSTQALSSSHQPEESNRPIPPPFQMTLGGEQAPPAEAFSVRSPLPPQSHQSQAPSLTSQSASYNPNVTYGFGSQLSPDELNLSSKERSQFMGEGAGGWTTPNFWRERYNFWADEIKFGRGRRAKIARATASLSAILFCFLIGLSLSRIAAIWSAEVDTPVPADQLTQVTPSKSEQQRQDLISEVETLVNQQKWSEVLTLTQSRAMTNVTSDLRLSALITKAEGELIRSEELALRTEIQRGQLKVAFRRFEDLSKLLSTRGKLQINYLGYTLWLYERELKGARRINPPRREQEILQKAAQLTLRGDLAGARRVLKRARASRSRRALFRLRGEANQATQDEIREAELSYLLGTERETQATLQLYKVAIKNGVRQTNYKEISPWIEGALKLSAQSSRDFESLTKTKQQLQVEARRWLKKAESLRSKPLQARALLEAALPYLEPQDEERARKILQSFRR